MSFLEKLAKIEALIQRSSSEGERQAAKLAKERVLAKIAEEEQSLKPLEYKITLDSPWKKRLFVAICAKYGYHTYRHYRQKYTTSNVKVRKDVMDELLWPEFCRYAKILEELVGEIVQDLTNKIFQVKEEEIVIAGEIGN